MIPALLLTLLLQGQDDGLQRALERGDYRQAWQQLEQLPQGLERERARVAILYRAGDPGAALEAARSALREAPADLELLNRACAAALWLQEGPRSLQLAVRLRAAIAAASLTPEQRAAWEASQENLEAQARAAGQHAQALQAAVARARGVALGVLVLSAALLGLGARRGAQGAQGRSSSPDS